MTPEIEKIISEQGRNETSPKTLMERFIEEKGLEKDFEKHLLEAQAIENNILF